MPKYVDKFFQENIPNNDIEENVTRGYPVPTNISKSM